MTLSSIVNQIDYKTDTIQAVYDWVAHTIQYDVAKLRDIEKGVNFYKKGRYKNLEEYKADLLKKVIKKKKGVCDDYSLLFHSIVRELGYNSFIVEGLTKKENGKVTKSSSHSWNAVEVDGQWKLYDVTWGSGYVNEKKKFVKKYSDKWYEVSPDDLIKTHLPFDPIWQLSESPFTYNDFEKGSRSNTDEIGYDYESKISSYLKMDKEAKIVHELKRSEENGGHISLLKRRRRRLKGNLDNYKSLNKAHEIGQMTLELTAASKVFGEYIDAKNKRFKGKVWTKEYSTTKLEELQEQIPMAIETLESSGAKGRSMSEFIAQSKKLLKRVEKELAFLAKTTP